MLQWLAFHVITPQVVDIESRVPNSIGLAQLSLLPVKQSKSPNSSPAMPPAASFSPANIWLLAWMFPAASPSRMVSIPSISVTDFSSSCAFGIACWLFMIFLFEQMKCVGTRACLRKGLDLNLFKFRHAPFFSSSFGKGKKACV